MEFVSTCCTCLPAAVGLIHFPTQILHSVSAAQLDAVNSMEGYVEETVLPNLKDVSKCWQPSDYLPDPSSPDFLDEVQTEAFEDGPVVDMTCCLTCTCWSCCAMLEAHQHHVKGISCIGGSLFHRAFGTE